jgi:hypothetical protein
MRASIAALAPSAGRKQLVDRYVAVWNDPDAQRRRRAVAELWTDDAGHTLQAPHEVRQAARALDVTADVPRPRPPRVRRAGGPRVRGVRRALSAARPR